ncbi:type I-E CRISPR-associated protein Cse2/CasB [Haloferula chungangensis]|uniref:Type I-E CRISPR-associated protein Cse2/CasB n=1 Tax=Haloferula chungangensis TaxID=1048331 RepID=A0ABW2L9W6_9BACT
MNHENKSQARKVLVTKLLACIDPASGETLPHARGKLADLKMFLRSTDTARNRAIPAFARLADADLIGDVPAETVATLFSLYPHRAAQKTWNFGTTCRGIADRFNEDAFDKHFERLLAARTAADAAKVILKVGPMARSKGIDINYFKLAEDLSSWSQKVRLDWARSYFKVRTTDAS